MAKGSSEEGTSRAAHRRAFGADAAKWRPPSALRTLWAERTRMLHGITRAKALWRLKMAGSTSSRHEARGAKG